MLGIPRKRCARVDVSKPVLKYLRKELTAEEAGEYEADVATLQRLHDDILSGKASDEVHVRYFAQLVHCEGRLPVSDTEIKVHFCWHDAFRASQKVTQSSLKYQQAGCLFNLGAIASYEAALAHGKPGEGLKEACRSFQSAAGIFKYLRDAVCNGLSGPLTCDLSSEALGFIVEVMLAQAQACIYEKAVANREADNMQPKVLAMIGEQAADFYSTAYDCTRSPNVSSTLDRSWPAHLQFQTACFRAAAQHWQAKHEKTQAESTGAGYGREIARLERAVAFCNEAENIGRRNRLGDGQVQSIRSLKNVVADAKLSAERDNDTVYHEQVPTAGELGAISKARLVKATPFDAAAIVGEAAPLFATLTSKEVRDAAQNFTARLDEMASALTERTTREASSAREQLASVGLPAAIEAYEGGSGLPENVWKKVASVQQVTGGDAATALGAMVAGNAAASAEVTELLQRAGERLNEEEDRDERLRRGFGAQVYTLQSSVELNASLRDDIRKYGDMLRDARTTDEQVRERLDAARESLALLSRSRQELDGLLPAAPAVVSDSSTSITAALSALLVQLADSIARREQLLQRFTQSAGQVGIREQLMRNAHSADESLGGAIGCGAGSSPQRICDDAMRPFTALEQELALSVQAQPALMERIMGENATFTQARAMDPVTRERTAVIQRIDDAVNRHSELLATLEQGSSWWPEITTRARQTLQNCEDHAYTRDIQRQEFEANFHAQQQEQKRIQDDALVAQQFGQMTTAGVPAAATAPGCGYAAPPPPPNAALPQAPAAPPAFAAALNYPVAGQGQHSPQPQPTSAPPLGFTAPPPTVPAASVFPHGGTPPAAGSSNYPGGMAVPVVAATNVTVASSSPALATAGGGDGGVAQLVDMGFSAESAQQALQSSGGNVDQAIAMLLSQG